jgi:hypothetical protein
MSQARKLPLSAFDGFIYNFLSMSVIFPWAFVLGRAAFPGANIPLALLLTFLIQVPLCIAYAGLAGSAPVSAGDYVYQYEAFGKKGSVIVLSGFVIWILQWVALSGWLFATLGLAPLLLSVAVWRGDAQMIYYARLVESPLGVTLISVLLSAATVRLLWRGLRLFAIVQRFLFAFTVAAVAVTAAVFFGPKPVEHLNAFAHSLITLGPYALPPDNFTGVVKNFASSPHTSSWHTLLCTLGIVPIAWTTLQWATYSVEQNSEIEGAGSFRKQLFMMLGSAAAVTAALLLTTMAESVLGKPFLDAAAGVSQSKDAPAALVSFLNEVLQPYPSFLAIASAQGGSGKAPLWPILVSAVVSLGFLANAFQITCNCFIGVGRILVRMAEKKDVPALFLRKSSGGKPSLPWAYCAYLVASLAAIWAYNYVDNWNDWALGVTFGCGYVFLFTSLAAARLPAKQCQKDEDGKPLPNRLIRQSGYFGTGISAVFLVSLLAFPQFGLHAFKPLVVIVAAILIAVLIVYRSSLLELASDWRRRVATGGATSSDDVQAARVPVWRRRSVTDDVAGGDNA